MNVRLVEKRVNKTVGIVIVANVMSQYRIPGMIVIIYNSVRPSIPNQERCPSTDPAAAIVATSAEVAVEFMFGRFVKFWRIEETVLERIDSAVTAVVPSIVINLSLG